MKSISVLPACGESSLVLSQELYTVCSRKQGLISYVGFTSSNEGQFTPRRSSVGSLPSLAFVSRRPASLTARSRTRPHQSMLMSRGGSLTHRGAPATTGYNAPTSSHHSTLFRSRRTLNHAARRLDSAGRVPAGCPGICDWEGRRRGQRMRRALDTPGRPRRPARASHGDARVQEADVHALATGADLDDDLARGYNNHAKSDAHVHDIPELHVD